MAMKKVITLKTAFWIFLVSLIISLVVAVAIPFFISFISVTYGCTTYANYSEERTKAIAPILAISPDVSKVQLPAGCLYLLLDKNYKILKTTLKDKDLDSAMNFATSGTLNEDSKKQYILVTRDNEYIILQYYVGSQFTNQWMNDHLPSPDKLLFLTIAFNCILISIILTTVFSKKVSIQLQPMFKATKEVANENLDFEVGNSKIKEFEDMLVSFSNMKTSLKISLEKQWKAEYLQKEQISALAHDLKTPLTVIEGNTDLICDTNLNEEQKLYANYILDSTLEMHRYIKNLIDISKSLTDYKLHIEKVNMGEYLDELRLHATALCQTKGIEFEMNILSIPKSVKLDKYLIERGLMNLISNALDYSPSNGNITMNLQSINNNLQFSIIDDGKGFSKDALLHGTEQFYMADESRNVKMHYGMGLYITNSIAKAHGGKVILENSKETGGGKVTIQIPEAS